MWSSVLKYTQVGFWVVCLGVTLLGAGFKDLTDDCKGQILCPLSGEEPLRFVGLGTERHWNCSLMNDNAVQNIEPASIVEIFPLYRDSDSFDVIAFTLCQVMPPAGKGADGVSYEERKERTAVRARRLKMCKALLKSYPSSRTAMLQRCLEEIDQEEKALGEILSRYGANSRASGDKIIERFQRGDAFSAIRSAALSLDFQIAFPCYFYLREAVQRVTERKLQRPYQLDLEKLLDKFGNELMDAYEIHGDEGRGRVTKYLALFQEEAGHWNEALPATLDEMQKVTSASLNSFLKSLEYSSALDFRRWGGAMLGVFRLLPNGAVVKVQSEAFDKALQNYSDKHN